MHVDLVYTLCKGVLPEASELALKHWGKVTNDMKETGDCVGSEIDLDRIRAKTTIDDQVQELFLQKLYEFNQQESIDAFAEEDTPTTGMFNRQAPYRLIVDPIDGTSKYIKGQPEFSINLALVSERGIEFSFVSFPAMNLIFENWKGEYYLMYPIDSEKPVEFGEMFELNMDKAVPAAPYCVQFNRRMEEELVERYIQQGMNTEPSHGAFRPIISMMKGECDAYVARRPQLRDILLHEILAGMYPDVFEIYDFQGAPVNWFSPVPFESYVFAKKGMREVLVEGPTQV